MDKVIFDTEAIGINSFQGPYFMDIYEITELKHQAILLIEFEENTLKIIFKDKHSDAETIFLFENIVHYFSYNIDYHNLYKIRLDYLGSLAMHLSSKYNKMIFQLYIWDKYNEDIPKLGISAERLQVIGEGLFNFKKHEY